MKEGEEIHLDVVRDDAVGPMFRSDQLPVKIEIPQGTIEIDQTTITFSFGDQTRTLTTAEFIQLMELPKNQIKTGNLWDGNNL